MDEMSVQFDDGTNFGEDQKKKNLGLGQPKINFILFYFIFIFLY